MDHHHPPRFNPLALCFWTLHNGTNWLLGVNICQALACHDFKRGVAIFELSFLGFKWSKCKKSREFPETLRPPLPASSLCAMLMCNAYVHCLCTMSMCTEYVQCLCAMSMCNDYVQCLCAIPMCNA